MKKMLIIRKGIQNQATGLFTYWGQVDGSEDTRFFGSYCEVVGYAEKRNCQVLELA